MTTIWERVHSDNHIFSLLCPFVVLVVSHLGFKGGNLFPISLVPGHCFPFTFKIDAIIESDARRPTAGNKRVQQSYQPCLG